MNINLENFLNNNINIEELIFLYDKNNYTREEIKENGIVYTPMYICDYIIKNIEPKLEENVFEPSVGHGIFVFSLLNYIENQYNLSSEELKNYFLNNIYVQDLQVKNIEDFKEIAITFFKKKNIKIEKSDIKNVFIGDTLFTEHKKYDIIIGNPPYVRIKNLEESYIKKLRKNYKSCEKGNIDIYYAFIEFALKNSYRSSFITPNSWLYNKSAENLRNLCLNNLRLLIDFKEKKIFQNASTYTSIFLFTTNNVIIKEDIHNINHNQYMIYKENLNNEDILIDKILLNNNRWKFNAENKTNIQFKSLVFKTPIATLRDKIFITNEIDTKDMIKFYKISKPKSEVDFLNREEKIIFPYKLDTIKNKFIIKEESELENKTIDYLIKNKEELNKRDKGKTDKYEKWYAYGRKQGLNIYNYQNNIIIIPGMISENFNFFSVSLYKIQEPFLFSSGILIEVSKEETDLLLEYLNSNDFKRFMKEEGKIWKGKNEEDNYYSLTIKQLKELFNS